MVMVRVRVRIRVRVRFRHRNCVQLKLVPLAFLWSKRVKVRGLKSKG